MNYHIDATILIDFYLLKAVLVVTHYSTVHLNVSIY